MKKFAVFIKIFLIGAAGYGLIEIIWRGYTHWSMLLTGGVCFTGLYGINKRLKKAPSAAKCAIGSVFITAVEFVVGCIVNLWLKLNVWNYSSFWFNLLGQVCLLYSFLWFVLCIPVMKLAGLLEKHFDKKPFLFSLFKK